MIKIKDYFVIGEYEIVNGLINTDDDLELIKEVKELPLQFGHVGGDFSCRDNQLTSLAGAPQSVGGNFSCYNNQLTSLEGAPQSVGGYFYCANNNQLTSLEGAPQSVGSFYYDWSENLPLLRLVRYKKIETYNNDQVDKIIKKYSNHKPLKEAILLCQKELIDNGFIGNASW
jgi:hypothetical protein